MPQDRQWLLHILPSAVWEERRRTGAIEPTPPAEFVHCAYAKQLDGVVSRHFPDPGGHVIVVIDRQRLEVPIVDETGGGGRILHPHVYGPIPVTSVVEVRPLVDSLAE